MVPRYLAIRLGNYEKIMGMKLFFFKYVTWIHEIATIPDGIWQQYEGPQMGF